MDIDEFLAQFVLLSTTEIIDFVSEHRRELQLLFIHAPLGNEPHDKLKSILRHLSQRHAAASGDERLSPQVQFLYGQLGLYFKRADDMAGVSNCIAKINPSVLRNRLEAWMHYQLYNDFGHNLTSLPKYLTKISAALSEEEESYENEVVRDMHTYYTYACDVLGKYVSEAAKQEFIDHFQSDELASEFPILHFYRANLDQFDISLEPHALTDKVFEPTEWSEQLFQDKIIEPIKAHERTVWNNILMGYSFEDAKSVVINFGQTDFDKPVAGLAGMDIVCLYAYCNMRMHYFAAQHLFERSDLFLTLYQSTGRVKFIDIGCGPATSGLALIEHLYQQTNQSVSFDYIGVDYFATMRAGAEYFMDNDHFSPKTPNIYVKTLDDIDFEVMEQANSLIFNASYLFASEYLDPHVLAQQVINLRKSQPECPCYFVFQNAIGEIKNAKYEKFKKYIGPYQKIYSGHPQIPYNNQRGRFNFINQQVYQEILKLD
ncbi:hypothetical protein [Pedobacter jeongneungensis]|uniref:hypothetical protein n=1 Tax=Pedobacter jeongneungensis TaxID=947309 RepID=UPI00046B0877|nr:hypothetical protein [Pedobacter jeongneungensis]